MTTSSGSNYCIYLELYFMRPMIDQCTQDLDVFMYCEIFSYQMENDQLNDENSIIIFQKVLSGCYKCENNLNLDTVLRHYPLQELWIVDCIPHTPEPPTCTNLEVVDDGRPECDIYSYYDKETNQCIQCSDKYTNCVACSATKGCIVCPNQMNWINQGYYDYATQNRQKMCILTTCDYGQCYLYYQNAIECRNTTILDTNCKRCRLEFDEFNELVQVCEICEPGYYLSSSTPSRCEKIGSQGGQLVSHVLFVRSTSYILKSPDKPINAKQMCMKTTDNTEASIANGFSVVSQPAQFLQQAFKYLLTQFNTQYSRIEATIYLGIGYHFLLPCSNSESYSSLTAKICTQYDLVMMQNPYTNHNMSITVRALECSFAKQLSLEDDPDFLSLCVNFDKGDQKPTIYVNSPYAQIHVAGEFKFINLKFSGINALARQSRTRLNIDLLAYPQLYCKAPGEPSLLYTANWEPTVLDTCLKNITKIQYSCSLPSTSPKYNQSDTNSTCIANQFKTYSKFQNSTLTCSGEPYHSLYFQQTALTTDVKGFRRRKTLFLLYGNKLMPTDQQILAQLTIQNCDFEYFLSEGYESLISIQSYSLTQISRSEPYIGGQVVSLNNYEYNEVFTGAQVTIDKSTFKHSQFCKGVIAFRNARPELSRSLLNLTDLYMPPSNFQSKTWKSANSFIVIKDSSFINLNAFNRVTALAISGPKPLGVTLSNKIKDPFDVPAFVHKGTVLNIEDFPGKVEIVGSNFERNLHYIPAIKYTGLSEALYSIDQFKDLAITKELQLSICSDVDQKDLDIFGNSIELMRGSGSDLDKLFDDYERLGLIYISRNQGHIIIKNNAFSKNIGTFGGAITINSPNWLKGNQPHVVIKSNQFQNNMAYFSGNAIYIRSTIQKPGQKDNQNNTCGGVNVMDNYFLNNIGMKVHNGGALSAYCHYIDSPSYEDYPAQSLINLTKSQVSSSSYYNASAITVTSIADNSVIAIQRYKFNVQGNYFDENFSGGKGSALFIRQYSSIRLVSNTFANNGPVYTLAENFYSPYLKQISGIPITFYDPICQDELQYIQKCFNHEISTQYGGLQLSRVQGAINIIFCETFKCIKSGRLQELEIASCQFSKNYGGPVLDASSKDGASQISITGGRNVLISDCLFSENKGSELLFASQDISKLNQFFSPYYMNSSHSPLIKIQVTPARLIDFPVVFNFTIQQSRFQGNQNIQVQGLGTSLYYHGSIIQAQNLAAVEKFDLAIVQLNIVDCDFIDNQFRGPETSLIYSSSVLTKIYRNDFQNNGLITQATFNQDKSLVNQYVSSKVFLYKVFSFSNSQQNGCITLDGDISFPSSLVHSFAGNTFKYIFSQQGGAYTFNGLSSQQVSFSSNRYSYIFSSQDGGVLYWSNSMANSTLLMEMETTEYLFGKSTGAITIVPKNPNVNIILKNSQFKNLKALSGQVLTIIGGSKLLVTDVSFIQGKNDLKSFLKLIKEQFTFITIPLISGLIDEASLISLVSIQQQRGYVYLDNVQARNATGVWFMGKTLIKSDGLYYKYAEFINCTFENNNANQYSSLGAKSSLVRIANKIKGGSNNKIIYNQAKDQGQLGFEGGSIFVLQNLTFFNNTSSGKASAVYLSASTGLIEDCTFDQNSAFQTATIYAEVNSQLDLQRSLFYSNFGKDSSALSFNRIQRFSVTNCSFQLNQAEQNLIKIVSSNGTFARSNFSDNLAAIETNGVSVASSKVSFDKIRVVNVYVNPYSSPAPVGFFAIYQDSPILITNSHFEKLNGASQSLLLSQGSMSFDSTVIITNSTVQYSVGQSTVRVSKNMLFKVIGCTFLNNSLVDIISEESNTEIQNSKFLNTDGNSIKVNGWLMKLINNTFIDKNEASNSVVLMGKAVQCKCLNEQIFENNIFESQVAYQGGGLYLTQIEGSNVTYKITKNVFKTNKATQGGAIYINDAQLVDIDSNTFDGNMVYAMKIQGQQVLQANGGGIYFTCGNDPITKKDKNCGYTLRGVNKFLDNSAEMQGGALIWTKQAPLIDNQTVFKNNTAGYGKNFASYPKTLKFEYLTKAEAEMRDNQTQLLLRTLLSNQSMVDKSVPPPFVSGGSIYLDIFIIDQMGEVYSSDVSSIAWIELADPNDDVVLKNNEEIANNGVYKFRDLKIMAQPGTQPKLMLDIQGLETYGNPVTFVDKPLSLNLSLRLCLLGEELTIDYRCVACPEGMYIFVAPIVPTSCKQCPKNAKCFGMSKVAPLEGYWRSSNISEVTTECPNNDVCHAGKTEEPMGRCQEGYLGIVCGNCAPFHFKQKQFVCQGCPEQIRNIVQTVLLLVALSINVILMVRSTLNSAKDQKPVHSVYLKILMNHIQILGAISNIEFSWPKAIKSYQEYSDNVSSASTAVFSFDCFLFGSDGIDNDLPVFFQKLIMYGLQPFLMGILSLSIWLIIGKIQKMPRQELWNKVTSTLIILLFFVHPDIAKIMFLAFNCIEIEGVFRMKENISNECYSGQHLFYISVVAFPAIGLWVFGIPIIALGVLIRNKRILNLMNKDQITAAENDEIIQLKMKYGFLFSGYKAKTFFWEVIVMYRKIFIIMTSVFLSTVSSETQVLVVIFIVVVNLFLQIQFQPYFKTTLNKMENFSLLVAIVTIYTGMYYVTGRHYTYMDNQGVSWFFLICILLPNVVFLLYWLHHMRIEILKILYRANVNPKLFMIVAFQRRESFEEAYMKDAADGPPEQVIIAEEEGPPSCGVQIGKEEGDNLNQPISLDDINFKTIRAPESEDYMIISEEYKQRKQKMISKEKTHLDRYKDDFTQLTSRSAKVYPEGATPDGLNISSVTNVPLMMDFSNVGPSHPQEEEEQQQPHSKRGKKKKKKKKKDGKSLTARFEHQMGGGVFKVLDSLNQTSSKISMMGKETPRDDVELVQIEDIIIESERLQRKDYEHNNNDQRGGRNKSHKQRGQQSRSRQRQQHIKE